MAAIFQATFSRYKTIYDLPRFAKPSPHYFSANSAIITKLLAVFSIHLSVRPSVHPYFRVFFYHSMLMVTQSTGGPVPIPS